MGKYTALDNPIVDQTVEHHLQQIVTAIRSRLEPMAIILRGSFGRGEGSVVVEDNRVRFLSDYEVMVITLNYRDRQWLETVARQMTARLGVETSIIRLHPNSLPTGYVTRSTIIMYELQNGGLTLYGQPLVNRGPAIDPRTLDLWSGLRLILNRMAESLDHVSLPKTDWEGLRWITKTVLSCADVLLMIHGQYHFSYAERGRRFADLSPELGTVLERAQDLPDLVRHATAFKLCPSLDLYPGPMPLIWQQVKQGCDATFRYAIEKYLGFSFGSYIEFPRRYRNELVLQNKIGSTLLWPLPAPISQNLFLAYRFLRSRRLPPLGLVTQLPYPAYQTVYSVVPLVFLGGDDKVLHEARHWLGRLVHLDPPQADLQAEWNYLRSCTMRAWKDFCYGLWETI